MTVRFLLMLLKTPDVPLHVDPARTRSYQVQTREMEDEPVPVESGGLRSQTGVASPGGSGSGSGSGSGAELLNTPRKLAKSFVSESFASLGRRAHVPSSLGETTDERGQPVCLSAFTQQPTDEQGSPYQDSECSLA